MAKKKKQYWLYYETLEFSAEIIICDRNLAEESCQYKGPFTSLTTARAKGIEMINQDLEAFRGMKQEVAYGKPREEE